MRKILLYLFLLIFLCFIIPIVFTYKNIKNTNIDIEVYNNIENTGNLEKIENKNIKDSTEEKIVENNYAYKQYSQIKLLHTETNEIEQIYLDEYLYGVVSAEMPASFEEEALKAQAIVARTYTIYKILKNKKKHGEADICDDSKCCQAWISKENRLDKWDEKDREDYWNKIINAVNETKGKIITYEGKPINAFFHANSGGLTEVPINVWGGTDYPYLQTVATSGEDAYAQYSSSAIFTKDEFKNKIKEKHSNFEIDFTEENCIKIEEYTDGNRVKTISIGNLKLSGVEIRNIFSLKSANFKIEIEGENIKFDVFGYGHGVGMSQTGADSLAKQGKNYEEIIKHYYKDVQIENI